MKNIRTPKDDARKPALKIPGTALLLAAGLLLILAGCQNPLHQQDAVAEADTGTLSLTINGQGSERTIMPPETTFADFVRFGLVFTPVGGGQPKSVDWCADEDLTDGTGMILLQSGTWDLVVTAFIMEEGDEVAAARSGANRIAVLTGGHVERNVVLLPIGGRGTFSWDIELLGAEVVTARMEILRYPGRGAFRGPYYLIGGGAPIGLTGYLDDLDAGQYFVVFTLSNGERNVRATEILRVYAYRTSHFDGAFSDDIFAVSLLYAVLDAWNGSAWDFDGAGIDGVHFAILGIEGANDDDGYFVDGIVALLNALTHNNGNPIVIDYEAPNAMNRLKALVDAALIGMAAMDDSFLYAGSYEDRAAAETAIEGLVRNGTGITISWPGNDRASVVIGDYEVGIIFDDVIFEVTLAAQLAWLRDRVQTGGRYYIEISDDEDIIPQAALTFPGRNDVTIVLRGVGAEPTNVRLSVNGAMFTVGYGVTLVLDENITLIGRNQDDHGANNNNSLIVVTEGALIMNDGARIAGNFNSAGTGGGVRVSVAGAFTMNGGEISGNAASYFFQTSGTVPVVAISRGGGVHVDGGAFTMNGGEIFGNLSTATAISNGSANAQPFGGGVYVGGGIFVMNDGDIHGNTSLAYARSTGIGTHVAPSRGGGVHVANGGEFVMVDGEIRGNAVSSTHVTIHGGGVYVASGGEFTMLDGEIFGNTGGGVHNSAGGTFRMVSGIVYGGNEGDLSNTATVGASLNNSGTAQFGAFVGDSFTQAGIFRTVNATINVRNGVIQTPMTGSLADQLYWLRNWAQSDSDYNVVLNGHGDISPAQAALPEGRTGLTITITGSVPSEARLSANGALFTVGSGVTLVLSQNLTLVGRNLGAHGANNNSSLVVVADGTLVMEQGSAIVRNVNAYGHGGGVNVSSTGTFIMNGGEISDNIVLGSRWHNQWDQGRFDGGGVFTNGAFTMSGGTISSNEVGQAGQTGTGGNGGGVHAGTGTVTITGGTISRNIAHNNGGGVFANVPVAMAGGIISHNIAHNNGGGVFANVTLDINGGEISSNAATIYGGGVRFEGTMLNMHDGIIHGNTARNGGGIWTVGTFNMYDGEVSANIVTATVSQAGQGNGGGVFFQGTAFNMRGGIISNNRTASAAGVGSTLGRNGGGIFINSNPGTFNMYDGEIHGNTAFLGGGVMIPSTGGTFNMRGGTIFGNTASAGLGGGVRNEGTFRISSGLIYGNEETVESHLRNTAISGGAAFSPSATGTGAAGLARAAQLGTFNIAGVFTQLNIISWHEDNTIHVVNGVRQ